MNKKHIISLAGDLASGKGTVSKILMDELNYGVYRNGEFFRQLAKEHNMDVTEFNKYVKNHPEIDQQIEKSAGEYAKTHDYFIIDARLGWYVAPESFKVYMSVDIDESARRAFNDENRKSSEDYSSIEEQKKSIQERYIIENERYWKLYKVRKDDMSNYDFVIDTTYLTPQEVANRIKEAYFYWLDE